MSIRMKKTSMCINDGRALSRRIFLTAGGAALAVNALSGNAFAQQPDFTGVCVDRIPPTPEDQREFERARSISTPQGTRQAMRGLVQRGLEIPQRGIAPPQKMAIYRQKRWPVGSKLKIAFLSRSGIEDRVLEYAKQWTEITGLEFAPVSRSAADIRISFGSSGHWSNLGTDARSVNRQNPTMNLQLGRNDPEREHQRVILHEFGHALGAVHEHSSPSGNIPWNKPKVIQWYRRTQGWTAREVEDQVFKRYAADQVRASRFDPDSIMLYPIPADQLLPGRQDEAVDWNTRISDTDKTFMAQMYEQTLSPGVSQGGEPGENEPQEEEVVGPTTLIIGANPQSGHIKRAGDINKFDFAVTAGMSGPHMIRTYGSTLLNVSLYGPDNSNRLIHPTSRDNYRPYDLINVLIRGDLRAGRYRVNVRHAAPTGTGHYGIRISRVRVR